jgi:hypothetical protein
MMPRFDFRVHAINRMFERNITMDDVKQTIQTGELVQDYPDDKPYPIRLVLGWVGNRPIHVVFASDDQNDRLIVITAYEPDPNLWEADFKTKKEKS